MRAPDEVSSGGRRRGSGLVRALILTIVSTAIPGTAHLTQRRRRAGLVLFSLFTAVVALGAFVATRPRQELLQLALQPALLLGVIIGGAALALAWSASVVWSYYTVRPADLSTGRQVIAGVTVSVLCAAVCAPLLLAASYAQAQRDLLADVFPNTTVPTAAGDDDDEDPWATGERLNVLLLGGDAHPGDLGIRTDVIILASVDPTTGRTVLLSLPRNLENAPMPFPALRAEFPGGFPRFLFSLWSYGSEHPQLVPGTEHPGATLLTATVEEITGLPVDYYALVDLRGFKKIINALGGVWIDVQEPVRYGKYGQFVIEAGYHKLDGRAALWFARSRYHTSDYDRMRRQRCLVGALVQQADPMTVLRNFKDLADATTRAVSTNIPRGLLPHLVELAPKIKSSTIRNVQFVPPLIETGDPNYAKIQRIAQRVINRPAASPQDSSNPTSPPPETPGSTSAPQDYGLTLPAPPTPAEAPRAGSLPSDSPLAAPSPPDWSGTRMPPSEDGGSEAGAGMDDAQVGEDPAGDYPAQDGQAWDDRLGNEDDRVAGAGHDAPRPQPVSLQAACASL